MSSACKRLFAAASARADFSVRLVTRKESSAASLLEPEFLRGSAHRNHPGVTNLKTLRLPRPLQTGALTLIHRAESRNLAERARALSNFLWSRKRAVEARQLRERAAVLERKWTEKEKDQQQGDEDQTSVGARVRRKVLSELKRTTYRWTPLKYDADLALIYMASRLAGGYAAVVRALHEIKKRDPSFAPLSLLDFGSGLGTVLWASHSHWAESLKEFVCVDASGAMNSLAEQLLKEGGERDDPLIKHVYFRQFLPVSPKVQSDLVVAAFSLSELPTQKDREETLLTLWRKTHTYLVLVENGTKEGHQILMEAKDVLLKRQDGGARDLRTPRIFAPCPHELLCPKLLKEPVVPCNFLQPYYPLPVSGSSEPLQEKFSYLVLSRGKRGQDLGEQVEWGRLISPVHRRPRHAQCQVCCPTGDLKRIAVTARHHGRDVYRCARSSDWGDRLPIVQTERDDAREE